MSTTWLHLVVFLFSLVGLAAHDGNHSLSNFGQNSEVPSTDDDGTSRISEGIKTAYGYVRQSQNSEYDNEDNSSSIQSQKQTSRETAKKDCVDDVKFFKDVNESGFSFEREGFRKLIEAIERQPRPIYLDRIDRLGRDTLETIYVAAEIHYEYEVPIVTAEHGEYELDKIDEQLDLVLNAIIAGKSVKNRVRAAWKSIKMRFGEERRWYSWFDKIPIGYQQNDEEWIEPVTHAEEVLSAIIHDLLNTEEYSTTVERIKKAAENESITSTTSDGEPHLRNIKAGQIRSVFESSDYDLNDFDGSKLKYLLTNATLIGDVRYPRNAPDEEQSSIQDLTLQTLDEDLFERVNSFMQERADEMSTSVKKNVDIETLADLGLLLLAVDKIDVIRPVCPECNRGMIKNGEDHEHPLEDGRTAHYWICPKYRDEDNEQKEVGNDRENNKEKHCQRKIPYSKEWKALTNELEEKYTDRSDIVVLKMCPPQS